MSWDPSYLPESASIGTSSLQEFNYRISSYLAICDGVAIAYYSVTGLYESNNGFIVTGKKLGGGRWARYP
jgi:hypothetical protein